MAKEDMTVTFVTLFSLTWIAGILTGSTMQWVIARGVFTKGWKDRNNQYNIIVLIAGVSAGLLSPFNFFNYYLAPDSSFGYSIYLLINWMTMTHSSIILVSRKLSITYRNPDLAFKRLLLINVAMLPVSLLVCVTWGGNYNTDKEIFSKISGIVEPIQMSLWGLIEFVLSGMFIVKMWAYNWTDVERQGIFVLVLVGFCDIASVVSNVVLGDYESTVVKAFVYCLRIRLEIGVLCTMSDFLSKKRRGSVYESKSLNFTSKMKYTQNTTQNGSNCGGSDYGSSHFMKNDQANLQKQWGLEPTVPVIPTTNTQKTTTTTNSIANTETQVSMLSEVQQDDTTTTPTTPSNTDVESQSATKSSPTTSTVKHIGMTGDVKSVDSSD